ncbi:F-box DNA helicase protein 1 [Hondaea fermentalgiana]|uniref:DNA 3'-5' helicase n=1 Tax=Hondaea fermentalgiana TaxID=2315210 RepID=A0A2R5H3T2_9STRA|nr:F-box DNA helicase protein 1 [Hondaea fermentalgiana]|eukprot:GBG35084.1 F-box DNA helicase protein 1 [Hondaea fermentalgiana]
MIALTQEQRDILGATRRPEDVPAEGLVLRVTAAAGTGKTTTLEALAEHLLEKGHQDITYLTFNRAAASDGAARLPSKVECRTLHSQAISSLELPHYLNIESESKVESLIRKNFRQDIAHMLRTLDSSQSILLASEKVKLAFFIRKTLDRFTASKDSLENGFSSQNEYNTYYPARLHHQQEDHLPSDVGDFYTRAAREVYDLLKPDPDGNSAGGFTTYDVLMKEAELRRAPIPGSVILIDESQDCTASQIKWVLQNKRGKILVFVGDAAQTIYGFRGAKSKFLMGIRDCSDFSLTKSFRFGQNIASAANLLLFVKEKVSPKEWKPYRVTGGAAHPGTVDVGMKDINVRMPFTLIAFTNITLLTEALQIIVNARARGIPLPKFAINGSGEHSGKQRWLSTLKVIDEVIKLRQGEITRIDSYEFRDRTLDWDTFKNEVYERSLSKFITAVMLVEERQENARHDLEDFRKYVIDSNVSPGEADILLTTVHAAKGQEWDTVVMCNDLCKLATFNFEGGLSNSQFKRASAFATSMPKASFALPHWSDDLNIWYVAVTRAKRQLFLPARFCKLLKAFQIAIHQHEFEGASDFSDESALNVSLAGPWLEEASSFYPYSTLLAYIAPKPEHGVLRAQENTESKELQRNIIVKEATTPVPLKVEFEDQDEGDGSPRGASSQNWLKRSSQATDVASPEEPLRRSSRKKTRTAL